MTVSRSAPGPERPPRVRGARARACCRAARLDRVSASAKRRSLICLSCRGATSACRLRRRCSGSSIGRYSFSSWSPALYCSHSISRRCLQTSTPQPRRRRTPLSPAHPLHGEARKRPKPEHRRRRRRHHKPLLRHHHSLRRRARKPRRQRPPTPPSAMARRRGPPPAYDRSPIGSSRPTARPTAVGRRTFASRPRLPTTESA